MRPSIRPGVRLGPLLSDGLLHTVYVKHVRLEHAGSRNVGPEECPPLFADCNTLSGM